MLKSDTAFSFLLGEGIYLGDVFQKNGVYAEAGEEETVEHCIGNIFAVKRKTGIRFRRQPSGISGS